MESGVKIPWDDGAMVNFCGTEIELLYAGFMLHGFFVYSKFRYDTEKAQTEKEWKQGQLVQRLLS